MDIFLDVIQYHWWKLIMLWPFVFMATAWVCYHLGHRDEKDGMGICQEGLFEYDPNEEPTELGELISIYFMLFLPLFLIPWVKYLFLFPILILNKIKIPNKKIFR